MKSAPAEHALLSLLDGNERFRSGIISHPRQNAGRRGEILASQHPIAAIVGCSDSRVPPEIVFDQGLGDLFVVRVAGNVLDDTALGSIEYAAEHLHVPLVLVLGHSGCGAVTAAASGDHLPGHMRALGDRLRPAIEAAGNMPGDLLDNAIRENVLRSVSLLSTSQPLLASLVSSGELVIRGAVYDLSSGGVHLVQR